MQTSLHIDGANCPTCFNETLDDLAHVEGIRAVHGSISGPCIEIDHDDNIAPGVIADTIRNRLHGIEMFSNEVRMVPLEPVVLSAPCGHHRDAQPVPGTSRHAGVRNVNDIAASMTLGDIVTLYPSLSADLERLGLDYCCHGARTLAAAAAEAGLDPQVVADELSAARVDESPAEWASLGLVDLVDNIESVHHHYLWAELPRISALVDKIVSVHGDRHPELAEVQRLSVELRADLEPHLVREEQDLFPMIRQLAALAGRSRSETDEIAAQIEALTAEHETVGEILVELNRVTGGYAIPEDGCATYAACYRALAELEADTHLHIHKESNVLFPAFRAGPTQRSVVSATS